MPSQRRAVPLRKGREAPRGFAPRRSGRSPWRASQRHRVCEAAQDPPCLAGLRSDIWPWKECSLESLARRQHVKRMNGGGAKRVCAKLYEPKWLLAKKGPDAHLDRWAITIRFED